ncbi:MAG: HNH endonuclease [Planctomycetota bacterium]
MKITDDQVVTAYEFGKRVYAKELNPSDAKAQLSRTSGLNSNSARDCLEAFLHMRAGTRFMRKINANPLNIYLSRIRNDFGVAGLRLAIKAAREHVEYQESYSKRKLPGLRQIIEDHAKTLSAEISLDEYQKELEQKVAKAAADSPEQRRKRLEAASKKPSKKDVTATVFERNPDVIAEVLARAKGVCEGCGKQAPFLRAKDGEPYLEVHHVVHLAEGGEDTVENSKALCPNCHRRSHYGKQDS